MTMELKRRTAKEEKRPPGRPRQHDYDKLFAKLAKLPNDPLEIACYVQRVLAEAMILTLKGQGNRERNQELRAFANSINRLIPRERLLRAEQAILGAAARRTVQAGGGTRLTPRKSKGKAVRG